MKPSSLGAPEQLKHPNYTPPLGKAIPLGIQHVLGVGVIITFGMVTAAGVSMLADVKWTRRNMVIFAISLSVGLGLQLAPEALQHLPPIAKVLMTSGLLPAAVLSIVLNPLLPQELDRSVAPALRHRPAVPRWRIGLVTQKWCLQRTFLAHSPSNAPFQG